MPRTPPDAVRPVQHTRAATGSPGDRRLDRPGPRQRRLRTTLAAFLVVLLAPQVVAAGTEDDPEVTDRCQDPAALPLQTTPPPQLDVCAGWIQGVWTPVVDDEGAVVGHTLDAVRVTVKVGGMLDHPLPETRLRMSWANGPCGQQAWVKFPYGGGADARFGENCSAEDTTWIHLAPGALELSDDRFTLTVQAEAVNGRLDRPLVEGVTLAGPQISSALCVGLVTAAGDFPCGNAVVVVDDSAPGRDHVLGQDAPGEEGDQGA